MNNNNQTKHGHRTELDLSMEQSEKMQRDNIFTRTASKVYDVCTPILTKHNPLPAKPTFKEKTYHSFMCPPHGKVAQWITKVFCAVAIWATFWAITGEHALPGGNFFGLLILVYASVLAAKVVELTPLPPLLGMLVIGFILQNVPKIDAGKAIHDSWASSLRTIALVVILMKAGVGLDPQALKKTKWMALRLAFFPCIVEALIDAIIARYMLDFSWKWAFLMGFVMSAVSPAVVIPSMTKLQEKRLGTNMGIPTLCIAACSINDVIAISGFSIVLGILFQQETEAIFRENSLLPANMTLTHNVKVGKFENSLAMNILHGPLEIIIGVVFGIILGVFLWFIPNKKSKNLLMYRFIALCATSLFATFGFRVAGYKGAGVLGTLIMSFTAGIGWRKRGWSRQSFPIKDVIGKMWKVFQPLLFGLIGNAVSLEKLMSGNIGYGIAMLFIGLVARLFVTFFCTFGNELNLKEKIFITIAWLPKATVQAAIGPIAYDLAKTLMIPGNKHAQLVYDTSAQVLTFAVLSILITAARSRRDRFIRAIPPR